MRSDRLCPTLLCTAALIASAAFAQTPTQPDFGSNVRVFSPSTPPAQMQAEIDRL